MWFKASAPGSLMLLGEYAVLEGGHALVAAVNRRMSVQLSPRIDSKITITSQLGTLEIALTDLEVRAPFQFVLTALKKYQTSLPSGCDLVIQSEFSDQMGFASSAAVTVATLKVIHAWLKQDIANEDLITIARAVVREVQGIGSGADVAACVLGGVVAYCAEPFYAEKLRYDYPLTVVYSGSKTKTVDAIRHVKNHFAARPDVFKHLVQQINACAQAGIMAAKENNHAVLGKWMNEQQTLMTNLQVNTPILDEIVCALKKGQHMLGAKISGSGLGDCVVGLGEGIEHPQKLPHVTIAAEGVYCEQT